MTFVGIHEAKTTLSQLIRRAADGEEVTITNNGRPVAHLVAVLPEGHRRIGGEFAGTFTVPEDVDETPPELVEYFS
jgi:prevent-host-death family protein